MGVTYLLIDSYEGSLNIIDESETIYINTDVRIQQRTFNQTHVFQTSSNKRHKFFEKLMRFVRDGYGSVKCVPCIWK